MAATVRMKRLRWSMFWAVVSYAVTTVGAALTTYLTSFDVTPVQGSLISTGVGLAVVLIGALIDHARDNAGLDSVGPGGAGSSGAGAAGAVWRAAPGGVGPSSAGGVGPAGVGPGGAESGGGSGSTRPGGRTSVAAALVLVLLLCGGGGFAITYGAHWAAGKVVALLDEAAKPPWERKTEEPGVSRLARPVTKQSGILTLTVTRVEVNSLVTMIDVTATNSGSEALSLPRAQLTVPGARTLLPDPAVSDFLLGSVPGGGELTGRIVFDGAVAGQATGVTLAFTSIFSMDFDAPRSLSINIPLNRSQT